MTGRRPTRWELAEGHGYSARFAELVETGADIHGEARLADALLPRRGRVLDVGAGMGRVAAELAARGHHAVAVEPDPALVAQSRSTYPQLPVLPCDARDLTVDLLRHHDCPTEFDLVVLVGNVMVFLAEHTEREVLARLRGLLAPDGRMLIGFHLADGPGGARRYPRTEFLADAAAAGLRVDLEAGSYELRPPAGDYAVWVLSAEPGPAAG